MAQFKGSTQLGGNPVNRTSWCATLLAGLWLGISAPAGAVDFYFDGYGGFTDPGEITPTTPADGADTNNTVDFPAPVEFGNASGFDTDITSFHTFAWIADEGDHSHLSINELTPNLPPDSTTFDDPVQGAITVDTAPGEVIGWLIHHNEVISQLFGPDNVAIHYHLDIYADAAKTQLLWQSGAMEFTLDVMETENAGAGGSGVCLDNDGGTTGSDTGFATPCPDRFRFAPGWPTNPTSPTPVDAVIGVFEHQGTYYAVFMSGFWDNGTLIGEAWSDEGTHNQFNVRARIESIATPTVDIEKLVSVDNGATFVDADTETGPGTLVGNDVFFKLVVTNTGDETLINIALTDTDFDTTGCAIPDSLAPGGSFECDLGPFSAVAGQHSNRASVVAVGQSTDAVVGDEDLAHYLASPVTAEGIPTLSEFGLIIMSLGMAALAVASIRRYRSNG